MVIFHGKMLVHQRVFFGKHAVSRMLRFLGDFSVEKDSTVPRHVTHRFDQLPHLGNLNDTQVNSIELSILVRSNRDFDAIKWSPKNQGVAMFLGLKSSTSGPWTFTQFFVGIRYLYIYIFVSIPFLFYKYICCFGRSGFLHQSFVRSGYYFLDIASSYWQRVRLIGTPEWLEMILLVKIGTSQHHGSCRVRFTLRKAPLSNYIPLHPTTGWLSIIVVLTVTISVSFSL